MGFEDEAEQSLPRPYRHSDGRSKRTCELTSSIVSRGTSFHRSVDLECQPKHRPDRLGVAKADRYVDGGAIGRLTSSRRASSRIGGTLI